MEQAAYTESLLQPDGIFEQAWLDETIVFKAGAMGCIIKMNIWLQKTLCHDADSNVQI